VKRFLLHVVAPLALSVAVLAACAPLLTGQSSGQPSTKNGEWPAYTADVRGSKYSPLDQIDASNFNKLEVAWRFKTDNLGPRPEYKLEGTPLMVKGVLYVTAGTRRSVVALDARTGELIWAHSLREGHRAAIAPRQLSGRGWRHTGCRPQSSGPQRNQYSEDRPARQCRVDGDENARDPRRSASDDDAGASAGRDAASLRQGDGETGRRGVDACPAERFADDLLRRRETVHRRRDERRELFR
jgi:quinoprotein glucose dehydrogenase